MIGIEKICYDAENNIVLTVNRVENATLYIFKRVAPEFWRYHDNKMPLVRKSDNIFCIDADVMSGFFDLAESYCVCDLFCLDEKSEQTPVPINDPDISDKILKETVYNKDYGKVRVLPYINNNHALSFRVWSTANYDCKILKLSESKEFINFRLQHNIADGNFDLFLACRENIKHDLHYRNFFKLKLASSRNKKFVYFRIRKDGKLFQNYFIKAKDIYDFVVVFDKYVFPCYSDGDLSTSYFDVYGEYESCFFTSEETYASLYVRESSKHTYKRKKIAIFGSCFTKEAFHSIDYLNPDYKTYYENGLISFHSSIISAVASPISYNPKSFKNSLSPRLIELYGDMELSKTFFIKLKEYSPDYLLIDLYADIAARLYQTNRSYVTDCFYFKGSSIFNDIGVEKSLMISDKERLELFKKSLSLFREKVISVLAPDRVVLIKGRGATERVENGTVSQWPSIDYIRYANILWDRVDELFEQTFPEAKIIDMRNKKYKSTNRSPLTFSPQHFESDYYRDLLAKFNKIVLHDMLNENKVQ